MYYPRVPSNLKNNVAKARCCRHSFPCKCLRDIDYSELGLLSIPIIFIQKQSTVCTNPNQREREGLYCTMNGIKIMVTLQGVT